MTNEQAIAHFKEQLEIFGGEHHEAMKVAIEALEKQIPKKPIKQKMKIKDCIDQIRFFEKTVCPSCGKGMHCDWKFCFECGQDIDWSEEYDR